MGQITRQTTCFILAAILGALLFLSPTMSAQAAGTKRCLRVEHIKQKDQLGGETRVAWTHNGVVGLYLDWSAFCSAAAHEIMTTVNGWRVMTWGGDNQIGVSSDLLNIFNWHLPTALYWRNADGAYIDAATLTPDSTQVTMGRTECFGYVTGGAVQPFAEVTNHPLMVKLLSGDSATVIDDPTGGASVTDTVPSFSNGNKMVYFAPIYWDGRGWSRMAGEKVKLAVWIGSVTGKGALVVTFWPECVGHNVYTMELSQGVGLTVQPITTSQGWMYIDVPTLWLVPGLNMIQITQQGDAGNNFTIGRASLPSTRRNHAEYFYTPGGSSGLCYMRTEWTFYRDNDYIDAQITVPKAGDWDAPDCASDYSTLHILNFAYDGEGDWRQIMPEDCNKLGRKAVLTWNKLLKPDGTVMDADDRTASNTLKGLTWAPGQTWWFYDQNTDGAKRWYFGLEAIANGTPGKIMNMFGWDRMTTLPYYNHDGLLRDLDFDAWQNDTTPTYWTATRYGVGSSVKRTTDPIYVYRPSNACILTPGADSAGFAQIGQKAGSVVPGKTYLIYYHHKDFGGCQVMCQIKDEVGNQYFNAKTGLWQPGPCFNTADAALFTAMEKIRLTAPTGCTSMTVTFKTAVGGVGKYVVLDLVELSPDEGVTGEGRANDMVINADNPDVLTLKNGEQTQKFRLHLERMVGDL